MTYSRFLPLVALLLAACATAPRPTPLEFQRAELDQIIAANRVAFERTHADEIARLAP